MQGAPESGQYPAQMAAAVMEAAREVAPELGMSEEEAAAAVAMGVLDAAAAAVRAAMDEANESKT